MSPLLKTIAALVNYNCKTFTKLTPVVTLVSSLRMRSFSRTEFLTTCVCAGQINTQQLLAPGDSVRARVRFHLPLFFRRFYSARCRRFFPSSMVCQGVSSPPSSKTVYFFTSRFCFLPSLFSPHCFYLRIVATVSSFKYNQICNVPALRGGGGFQKSVVFQN